MAFKTASSWPGWVMSTFMSSRLFSTRSKKMRPQITRMSASASTFSQLMKELYSGAF